MSKALSFLAIIFVFAPALLVAEDKIDFATQIQPILLEHCAKCHGEKKAEGEIRLHSPKAIYDSDAQHLLGDGDPDASEIFSRITLSADDELMMPKGDDRLPEETIALIRKWIEQGGQMPEIDFATQIQPIFVKNCAKCHGEQTAKGGIRLHSPKAIRDSDVHHLLGDGDPDASEILSRISRSADDEMMMPKAGDRLPEETIALIRKWIEQGGQMPEEAVGAATVRPEDMLPDVPPAAPEIIQKLTAAGAQVKPLFRDCPLLRVAFLSYADKKAGDDEVVLLADVAPQVVQLNLARSEITDAGTTPLASLENLSHLSLELTAVGDDALAHLAGLKNLQYLNLYGTHVTDAGLEHLKGLQNLKKLYLWQTRVSFDAAMAFQKSIEGLEVDLGWNHPEVARRRVTDELARVKATKEDAASREEQARIEKEAAAQLEAELEAELKELAGETKEKPTEEKAAEEKELSADESESAEEKPAN